MVGPVETVFLVMTEMFEWEFLITLTNNHARHVSHQQFFLVCELQHSFFDYFHRVDGHFRHKGWNIHYYYYNQIHSFTIQQCENSCSVTSSTKTDLVGWLAPRRRSLWAYLSPPWWLLGSSSELMWDWTQQHPGDLPKDRQDSHCDEQRLCKDWKVTAHTVPWHESSITSMTVHNTPWMYSAVPLTKSFATLKAFLPMTTGSMKLRSEAPGEDTVLFIECR